MTTNTWDRVIRWVGVAGVLVTVASACKPSDILNSTTPAGLLPEGSLQGQAGAEQAFAGAEYSFEGGVEAYYGLTWESGLMSDEFTATPNGTCCGPTYLDGRYTSDDPTYWTPQTGTAGNLISARSQLLIAEGELQKYETGASRSLVGEAYALVGYTEVLLAEDFCAGTPLSTTQLGGGVVYGHPLSNDSLLGVAELSFDSALAYASGNDTVQNLAAVGLGRTLVDRARFDSAATVVQSVPTNFVYNVVLAPSRGPTYLQINLYETGLLAGNFWTAACSPFNVSDVEGHNGLNFVSAKDPRLTFDITAAETCDGAGVYGMTPLPDSVFYYPVKFGEPSTSVPLATGIEARLIAAEAALPHNGGTAGAWLADLNAMRNTTCSGNADSTCSYGTAQVIGQPYGLVSLTDPGSDSGEVSLMMRERAFWLFGTGTRLGDLRRLVRQYSRPAETVYPTGTYDSTLAQNAVWLSYIGQHPTTYGTDVNLGLPSPNVGTTPASSNPYYKGCTASTGTA